MHPAHYRFANLCIVLAMAMATACSTATDPDRDAGIAPLPLFQSDSASYVLRSTDIGYEGVIGFTFKNQATSTANFVNCQGGTGVELQKLVDGTWKSVWSPVLLACLSAPIVVAPGATHQFTIHVFGAYPGTNFFPQFAITDVAGAYRAVWTQLVTDYQDHLPFGNPLPLEHRISNQFTISVKSK